MKRKREPSGANERFATKAVIAIAIFTVLFVIANIVIFIISGSEPVTLIEWYFRGVVIECGALMLKRIAEVFVGRIEKKEDIKVKKDEDNFDGNQF